MPSSSRESSLLPILATGAAGIALVGYYYHLHSKEASTNERRATKLASRFGALRKEIAVAVGLALECGEAMRACRDKSRVEWKDDAGIDPVTQTDQDNELLVTKRVSAAFPEHAIIGEEAAAAAGAIPALGASTPTWIVDPIDGTQNFTHGAPLSVVSIGLCVGGVPVMGVVYDPYADEVFAAAEGQGAWLNGAPITVDGAVDRLQRALLCCDVGYERSAGGIGAMTKGFERLLQANVQSLRIIGSTVLSLAWVACGRANAFAIGLANEGAKPWDYCAAFVIATEAGATFRRLDSRSYGDDVAAPVRVGAAAGPFDIYSRSCVCAGSAALADEIVEVICTSAVATF